ncbi:hypothetical protein BWI97_20575 [Siphonobacter sp. BAB-5405]|uniref:hypothetical protein n=1 Tax=Siphonobacter sp. BAB-5405 TaxID=1864825 RepID=UPI000C8070F0|nr:hypothetical protein [Siphonobacter sp. BAB-5405]PMD92485.1 hypothetical protein BWI97_20575 [Siphonobacter sp. BAB-5405]
MITDKGPEQTWSYYYLERCCQRVAETYGREEWSAWTNGDYILLSRILFRKTRVQISPNTLKRIFGKIKTDARYYPQKATRDALAAYAGFGDWDQLVEAMAEEEPLAEVEEPLVEPALHQKVPERNESPVPKRFATRTLLWTGMSLLVLLVLWAGWKMRQGVSPEGTPSLICKNPVGENPHSAIFTVQTPHEQADDYSLDFGDGKCRAVNPNTTVYNHYYEVPGRYQAVLKRGNQPLDSTTVYLPTQGWAATAYMMYDTSRVYPIDVPALFTGGKRTINTRELSQAGIDTNRTFFVEFTNAQQTGISGDNFELQTHLITTPDRTGIRCSQVDVRIMGESSNHTFVVTKPGCVYWSRLILSEKGWYGRQEDLSFLGADLRRGGTLRLLVKNQQARLYINDRQVFESTYTHPLQQIYGVSIRFSGVGTVSSLNLKDLNTGKLFQGSF